MKMLCHVGLVSSLLCSNLLAASLTWDADTGTTGAQDGAGGWGTTGVNWWDGAGNVSWDNGAPDAATFGAGGAAGTVDLGEPVWAAGLTFAPAASGNYNIRSNVLTLAADAVVNVLRDATISSILDGTNFTKSGAASLTLNATNLLTGQILVNSGTVVLARSGALGASTSVVLNVSTAGGTGTTLGMQGGVTNGAGAVLVMNSTGALRSAFNNVSGNSEWTGTILLRGNGLCQPQSASGLLTLSGDVTNQNFAGTFFVRGNANGQVIGNVDAGAGVVNKTDNGTWTIGAPGKTYRWGATQVSAGTLRMGDANVLPRTTVLTMGQGDTSSPTLDLNGFDQTVAGLGHNLGTGGTKRVANLHATTPATFTVSNTASQIYGGVLTNGAAALHLVKSGAGTLTLTGTNGYSGFTTIEQGVLVIGAAGRLGSGSYAGDITNKGTLFYSGSQAQTLGGTISGTGPLFKNGTGTLTLSGASTYTGETRVDNGTLVLAGANDRLPTAGTIAVHGDGSSIATLDLNGLNQTIGLLNGTNVVGSRVALGAGTLTFAGTGSATGVYYGVIGGGGALAMSSGAQVLSSSNAYTGGTTLTGGRLIVRHDTALGTNSLTVNGGGLMLDAAGLWGGPLAGGNNRTDPNSRWTVDLKTTFANTTDTGAFASNTTWVYTGYLNVTNAAPVTWTFGERFDDTALLRIDGAAVLDDVIHNVTTKGTVTLAPGLHSFEVRVGQSTGGVGPNGGGWTLGIGYDPLGRDSVDPTNFVELVDAGDGGLFQRNDLRLVNNVTLNADLDLAVPVGGASLSGTLSGPGGLTKTGGGSLRIDLLAINDGPTVVSEGALSINGVHAGTGSVSVATNAILWGTGTVNSAATTIGAGGWIGPSSTAVTGTLTVADLDLAADARVQALLNGAVPTLHVTGDLNVSATIPLYVLPLGVLTAGTNVLIDYDGAFNGAIGDFDLVALPNGAQGYLTNDLVNTSINLVLTNAGAGLKWVGGVDGAWDVGLTPNWEAILTATATAFWTFDNVRFDDSATGNFSVTVAQPLTAGAIVFSNDVQNYVVSGQAIGGSGGLTKDGTGRVTIQNVNTFTGSALVRGGTLAVASDAGLGVPPATPAAGHLRLLSGVTLEVVSNTSLASTRRLEIGPSSGSGVVTVSVPAGVTATELALVANPAGATGGLIKTGSGTLTLNPASPNTYSGHTVVEAGTLVLAFGNQGQNLGTIGGKLTVNTGAVVRLTAEKAVGFANFSPTGNVTTITINEALFDHAGPNGHGGGQTVFLTGGEIRSNGGVPATNSASFRISGSGADPTVYVRASTATSVMSGRVALDFPGHFNVEDGPAEIDLLVTAGLTDGIGVGFPPNGITKSNSGTMALSGPNNYSLVTRIAAGTLQLGANGIAGRFGKGLVTNDARLVLNLVSGVLTNFISGTGVVVQAGAGVTTLTALNNCSGGTQVSNGTLLVDGAIGNGAVTIAAGATLGGTGTVGGAVTSDGIVSPGSSAGTLTLSSGYAQNAGGSLAIELGGTSQGVTYDHLSIAGAAALGGTLDVTFINGYTGTVGDVFVVLSAGGGIGGTFATTNLPSLPGGATWDVQYVGTFVMLTINSGTPPAGYDLFAGQIPNAADRGYQNDPDGDGYANLLEYVTGGNPTNADIVAQMKSARTNGVLALKFSRSIAATDATLYVEGSYATTNDATWTGIATNLAGSWGGAPNVSETGGPDPMDVTVADTDPAATNRFLRLRVTRP